MSEDKRNTHLISLIKGEINELWKLQNLIDLRTPSFLNVKLELNKTDDLLKLQKILMQIDLIENFNVSELNKDYVKNQNKILW